MNEAELGEYCRKKGLYKKEAPRYLMFSLKSHRAVNTR